jgi:hypothetical protein
LILAVHLRLPTYNLWEGKGGLLNLHHRLALHRLALLALRLDCKLGLRLALHLALRLALRHRLSLRLALQQQQSFQALRLDWKLGQYEPVCQGDQTSLALHRLVHLALCLDWKLGLHLALHLALRLALRHRLSLRLALQQQQSFQALHLDCKLGQYEPVCQGDQTSLALHRLVLLALCPDWKLMLHLALHLALRLALRHRLSSGDASCFQSFQSTQSLQVPLALQALTLRLALV